MDEELIMNVIRNDGAGADQELKIREVLEWIAGAGFWVVKPSTLELEVPGQIRACLMTADLAVASGDLELARQKIDAAVTTLRLLGDYLRELERLGTVVPISWPEFVRGRFEKNLLTGRDIDCDKESRSTRINSGGHLEGI